MSYSCIIIDDEPNAVKLLESYVQKTPSLTLKHCFYDGVDALDYLKKGNVVDIIFSDIQMPLLTGMELAELLPPTQKFVFTTAYSQHALPAFSFYTVDYLLKPISFKRFQQAVLKLENMTQHFPNSVPEETSFVYIKSGKQFSKLVFAETLFISGAKEYADVHTLSGHFLVYKRLKDLETLLPKEFIRVHNSYIVNVRFIERYTISEIYIRGKIIPIGDSYRGRLKDTMPQL
jgi:two-component system, LytTR family, response regulator